MQLLVLAGLIFSTNLFSIEPRITVKKEGDYKTFKAVVSREYIASLDQVIKGIENFDDKCNNAKRSKRKVFKWEKKCRFHNENLVVAVKIYRPMDENLKKYSGYQYLVWRNIYNSGKYSHYDVVTKKTSHKEVIIMHEMLNDNEINKILKDPERIVSAFEKIKGTYKVTKKRDDLIKVEYIYESRTDHWFLTKDFIEKRIKDNITSGTLQALKSIELSLKESRLK